MESPGFWSGVLQNVIAGWIHLLAASIFGVLMAVWVKYKELWSWPAAVIALLVVFACVLYISGKLFPATRKSLSENTATPPSVPNLSFSLLNNVIAGPFKGGGISIIVHGVVTNSGTRSTVSNWTGYFQRAGFSERERLGLLVDMTHTGSVAGVFPGEDSGKPEWEIQTVDLLPKRTLTAIGTNRGTPGFLVFTSKTLSGEAIGGGLLTIEYQDETGKKYVFRYTFAMAPTDPRIRR